MISLVIGTQGELIKLAPVAAELAERDVSFGVIYTGQHGRSVAALSRMLGLPPPDHFLKLDEVSTSAEGFYWLAGAAIRALRLGRDHLSRNRDVCVVQGDTLSTLVGLVLAKRSRLYLAHVEAGLRSNSVFEPFPEEIIRGLVDAHSDLLFAPSSQAVDNLRKQKVRGKVCSTGANTVVDALRLSLKVNYPIPHVPEPYAVATIHRFETIASHGRLLTVLHLLRLVAEHCRVVFLIPKSTRRKIETLKIYDSIMRHPNFMNLDPLPYPGFVRLINNAEFLVTDSGGIQQESFYLGKPCLLLRKRTEWREGLGENVCISGLSEQAVKAFVLNHESFSRKPMIDQAAYPSRRIVDTLLDEGFGG